MLWTPMLFALVVAILIALPLVMLAGWRRPGAPESEAVLPSVLFFFAILFLATWAGGAWLSPVGPVLWGAPWLGWLLFAIIVALILGAAGTGPRPVTTSGPPADPTAATTGFGLLFWTLLVVLFIVAISGTVQS